MVIAGRAPIDRQYERLLFDDIYPDAGYIPLRHAGNLPHRVMSFEVGSAEERWAAAGHPLYDFIFRTVHPDIMLDASCEASRSLPMPGMRSALGNFADSMRLDKLAA
jgi:hypothetical protein